MENFIFIYSHKMKTFNQFINEGKLGPGSRAETAGKFMGRAKDDKYADEVFNEMIKDYEESGKNLKKIHISSRFSTMRYYFGTTRWDAGNRKVGDKEVRVNAVNNTGALFEILEWHENPKHDPNYQMDVDIEWEGNFPHVIRRNDNQDNRDKMRIYDQYEEQFYISRNLARKMIIYFANEYDKQYPQLKNNQEGRSYWQIKAIENGEKIRIGWVDQFAKNGVECIFDVFEPGEKEKYEKWIKNSFAVKTKSKDGYPITFCYPAPDIDVDKVVDPYGEEEWGDDSEQGVIEWLNTLTKKEIEEKIQKEINKY